MIDQEFVLEAFLVGHNIGETKAHAKAEKLAEEIEKRFGVIMGAPLSPAAMARFALRATMRCWEIDANAAGHKTDSVDRIIEFALESDTAQNRELIRGIASDAMSLCRKAWPDKKDFTAQLAALLLLLVVARADEEVCAS